jgi:hypothetical protein
MKKLLFACALALGAVGCEREMEHNRPPATTDNGTGGSGYEAEDSIGEKNGVIDDGEGPLERDGKADDKIGNEPGVFDDGEGPIENRQK